MYKKIFIDDKLSYLANSDDLTMELDLFAHGFLGSATKIDLLVCRYKNVCEKNTILYHLAPSLPKSEDNNNQ